MQAHACCAPCTSTDTGHLSLFGSRMPRFRSARGTTQLHHMTMLTCWYRPLLTLSNCRMFITGCIEHSVRKHVVLSQLPSSDPFCWSTLCLRLTHKLNTCRWFCVKSSKPPCVPTALAWSPGFGVMVLLNKPCKDCRKSFLPREFLMISLTIDVVLQCEQLAPARCWPPWNQRHHGANSNPWETMSNSSSSFQMSLMPRLPSRLGKVLLADPKVLSLHANRLLTPLRLKLTQPSLWFHLALSIAKDNHWLRCLCRILVLWLKVWCYVERLMSSHTCAMARPFPRDPLDFSFCMAPRKFGRRPCHKLLWQFLADALPIRNPCWLRPRSFNLVPELSNEHWSRPRFALTPLMCAQLSALSTVMKSVEHGKVFAVRRWSISNSSFQSWSYVRKTHVTVHTGTMLKSWIHPRHSWMFGDDSSFAVVSSQTKLLLPVCILFASGLRNAFWMHCFMPVEQVGFILNPEHQMPRRLTPPMLWFGPRRSPKLSCGISNKRIPP